MRLVRFIFVLSFGLLTLPACDLFGSAPGSFEVSVTGDATASFSGEPVTIVNPAGSLDPSEQRYLFRLAASGNDEIVSIAAASDGVPELAEGTYDIGRFGVDLGPGRAEAIVDLEDNQAFLSLSGTLTLTEVTDDRVRGSFELEAVEGNHGDGEITVQGSFEADLSENTIS
ncbi:MAG: hypothetical protein AAF845_08995 [Bacteroidota bacterium]